MRSCCASGSRPHCAEQMSWQWCAPRPHLRRDRRHAVRRMRGVQFESPYTRARLPPIAYGRLRNITEASESESHTGGVFAVRTALPALGELKGPHKPSSASAPGLGHPPRIFRWELPLRHTCIPWPARPAYAPMASGGRPMQPSAQIVGYRVRLRIPCSMVSRSNCSPRHCMTHGMQCRDGRARIGPQRARRALEG